jgi:hypothetical protein
VRSRALKLVVAILATLIPLGVMAVPAHAETAADQFLAKINTLRASKGLGTLKVDPALTTFAQGWSDHMGAVRTLSHNPALANSPGDWTKAGENVGVGAEVDSLFDAFVASPHHYENLVDPAFNLVGIGVTVLPDGTMYTTHDFESRPASTATTVARRATVTTAPRPVTTTAAPRPTTTTTAPRPKPTTTVPTTAPAPVATSTPVPAVAAAPAPTPPSPATPAAAPARITLSLEQMRGLDPVL